MIQQRNLVLRLNHSRVAHQLLPVDNFDAFFLQGKKNRRLDHVDSQRFLVQTALFQLHFDLSRHIFRAAHFRRHRPAQQRNARARPFA